MDEQTQDRAGDVYGFICKCAREMTRADFDKMMHEDRNMKTVFFSSRPVYVFGETIVSPDFVDAIFSDPEYYEKMFKNA